MTVLRSVGKKLSGVSWKLKSTGPGELFEEVHIFWRSKTCFEDSRLLSKNFSNFWSECFSRINKTVSYVSIGFFQGKVSRKIFDIFFGFWAERFATFNEIFCNYCQNCFLSVQKIISWEEKIFLNLGKKFPMSSQTCILRILGNILRENLSATTNILIFFCSIENFLDFKQKVCARVSEVHSTCPEKFLEKQLNFMKKITMLSANFRLWERGFPSFFSDFRGIFSQGCQAGILRVQKKSSRFSKVISKRQQVHLTDNVKENARTQAF